jgi:uncharacterized protein (TIGR02588 family)
MTASEGSPARTAAEWATFAAASAILLVVVALLAVRGLQGADRPADVVVERSPLRQVGSQFYLPVTVHNRGDRTAEAVQVVAELTRGGTVVEAGEQTVDFLSGAEREQLEFVFTQDPSSGEVTVRAASFLVP